MKRLETPVNREIERRFRAIHRALQAEASPRKVPQREAVLRLLLLGMRAVEEAIAGKALST